MITSTLYIDSADSTDQIWAEELEFSEDEEQANPAISSDLKDQQTPGISTHQDSAILVVGNFVVNYEGNFLSQIIM